jgi:hypothetical protein
LTRAISGSAPLERLVRVVRVVRVVRLVPTGGHRPRAACPAGAPGVVKMRRMRALASLRVLLGEDETQPAARG